MRGLAIAQQLERLGLNPGSYVLAAISKLSQLRICPREIVMALESTCLPGVKCIKEWKPRFVRTYLFILVPVVNSGIGRLWSTGG